MNEDEYTSLILKDLHGEIKPSEKNRLEAWLDLNEHHRQIYEEIKMICDILDNIYDDLPQFDIDEEIRKLDRRLVFPISPKNRKNIFLEYLKYAAIFLLLLTSSIFWYLYQTKIQTPNITMQSESNGEQSEITLPDSSLVIVKHNSKTMWSYNDDGRNFNLLGEAFFRVKSDPRKPFIVAFGSTSLTALGSSFSVNASKNDTSEVVVHEGIVIVSASRKAVKLSKGEKLQITSKGFSKSPPYSI